MQFAKALHLEEAWLPILTARTDLVVACSAGMSQVAGELLQLFSGACGADLEAQGMQLVNQAGDRYGIFVRLHMVLQDGGAHKLLFHCKGDSGTKMCMLYRNLYASSSEILDEDGTNLLTCDKVLEEELSFATDADVIGTIDRLSDLKAEHVPSGLFKIREQAAGFTYHQHGVLQNMALRYIVHPVSIVCHDWMHCFCSTGVLQIIVVFFLKAMFAHDPQIYDSLRDYIKAWNWPSKY